jgi:hypothetical protein
MSRVIATFISILITLALLAGVGAYAYQAGVQQGIAQAAKVGDGATVAPYTIPYFGFAPFYHFSIFSPFGCVIPLFFIFLFVCLLNLIRFALWGPRWGHHHGWRKHWMHGEGVPPMFEEWHKKAHGEKTDEAQK